MFKEKIQIIDPLTKEYVDSLVKSPNEFDYSLTQLGIVCFMKKVPDYRGIGGTFLRTWSDKEDAVRLYTTAETKPVDIEFSYIYYCGNSSCDEERLAKLGFKHKTQVEALIHEKFNGSHVDVLYNTERNAALVFTNNDDLGLYHLILSFLPMYYPGIYTTPVKENDPEVPVLCSLSYGTSTLFKKRMSEALSEYRHIFCKAQVAKLLECCHQAKIQDAIDRVNRAKSSLECARNEYRKAYKTFNEAMVLREGTLAMESAPEWENDLISYLGSNDKIHDLEINDFRISFTVATTIQQFDLDAWNTYVQRGSVFMSERDEPPGVPEIFRKVENRKLFFDSIFSESPKFEVKTAGYYELDVRNMSFNTRSHIDYASINHIYKDYLPNPHLQQYACLGQYESRVIDVLEEGDIITAFELCVYSAGSLNMDEVQQNVRPFMRWIMGSDSKILRRFDGVEMTPKEALLWLIDNKEKENEAA